MKKKLISVSVYGHRSMYLRGAEANARLVPKVYPGWTMRVYCSRNLDATKLKKLGCDVVQMPLSRRHAGMFWRFLAAWDEDVERVIVRDVDSRLNVREAAAVAEWEASGMVAHCMMDHPHHAHMPMSGGMWGIVAGYLPQEVFKMARQMSRRPQQRVADMKFLRDHVHPLIKHTLLRHSSVETKWPSIPFPDHLKYDGFVGQQYDNDGEPVWPKVSGPGRSGAFPSPAD